MFPPKLLVSGFCAGAGIVFAVMMLLIKMEIVHTDEPRLTNPGIVSERPDFGPSQIRSLDQLRYGVPVMICRRDICSDVRRVVQAPYVDEKDGSLRIKVFLKDERGFRNESISLADWGVIPYPGGGWNATNWLRKVTE